MLVPRRSALSRCETPLGCRDRTADAKSHYLSKTTKKPIAEPRAARVRHSYVVTCKRFTGRGPHHHSPATELSLSTLLCSVPHGIGALELAHLHAAKDHTLSGHWRASFHSPTYHSKPFPIVAQLPRGARQSLVAPHSHTSYPQGNIRLPFVHSLASMEDALARPQMSTPPPCVPLVTSSCGPLSLRTCAVAHRPLWL